MLPKIRDSRGRFTRGWHLTKKGYPRYHAGPYRNQYVHRVQMMLVLGRELKQDEDVHHKNGDKKDFSGKNLTVLGHQEHGFVSAKQHFYVSVVVEERERKWYEECGLPTNGVGDGLSDAESSFDRRIVGADSSDCSFDPSTFGHTEAPVFASA